MRVAQTSAAESSGSIRLDAAKRSGRYLNDEPQFARNIKASTRVQFVMEMTLMTSLNDLMALCCSCIKNFQPDLFY